MTRSSRREFLGKSSLLAGASLSFPNIVSAQKTGGPVIIGEGEHKYEVDHTFAKLPAKYSWQTTHNVAVDAEQNLYVMHEGNPNIKDHPSIFVFDPTGKFIRAFGSQFQGGGHGIEVRSEGKEQFLYITAYQNVKSFAKLTLKGDIVWYQRAPMASGRYAKGEDTTTQRDWGRNKFMPTNTAFHPSDGSIYLADGYGAHCIHRYDSAGRYLATIGKPGKGDGEFNLPHGLWIDSRNPKSPTLCVADRANSRLQWFDLDGKHLKTLAEPFILPANVDVYKDLMLIPDLSARLTLLDKDDNVIHLANDDEWRKQVTAGGNKLRSKPDKWIDGKFVHPHDACFDKDGNIFVAEWVSTGRITKLKKV
ncbi:MAG: 6-bladed beta-propeller [Akkermansiaceae bacterium]|nr:6-bladed beta-propeller [Akkermansiaceae bacterium]